MKKIWLSPPHLSGNELQKIQQVFQENWIAPVGPQIAEFEARISSFLETEGHQVVATNSATSALHLALKLLNIGEGDVVICQSLSFAASVNPVLYQGALPVFVDSEKETYNLSPDFLEEAIKDQIKKRKKPKAIIAVHIYGMPYKVDEIHRISAQYEIPIIEDAAEAMGSYYRNKPCGSYGDLAIYSFNGNKIITTSAGGALICSNKIQKNKAIFWATQSKEDEDFYLHKEVGYNYRMSNVLAAIGLSQLDVLEERVKKKQEIQQFYSSFLNKVEGFKVFKEASEEFFSNHWLTILQINPEKSPISVIDLMKKLAKKNIESRRIWKPLHTQPVFAEFDFYGSEVAEKIFENGLCLPSGTAMTKADLQFIKTELLAAVKHA
ncbi:DegT/DnrJ/EryC1/StrS family aminotransferase [Zunongwangia sp. HGR-M22]|uniref:DegT/DnrJ/EryC1/StrS family aminotransferase n=1 Tax=Zunongwangia sp. HGR-M22 TaxID=3015168 RepID=UPI0022DDC909|nr:aminotransferase class I/II-fold pyridoxal phosphate-dependent enzyme [Zunongwangia sp. HGR-M22]WBL26941.1 aminotransferase class I/II-fold pyridoxal phosphate-dependent enzyme [Zunongwangia sp. HGR-M22]